MACSLMDIACTGFNMILHTISQISVHDCLVDFLGSGRIQSGNIIQFCQPFDVWDSAYPCSDLPSISAILSAAVAIDQKEQRIGESPNCDHAYASPSKRIHLVGPCYSVFFNYRPLSCSPTPEEQVQ